MLLANDDKLKLHFLNAKINLKRYLRLSAEINRSIHKKMVVGIETLNHQNEAFKAYQGALEEYSRLLQERKSQAHARELAKLKGQSKRPLAFKK